MRVEVGKVYKDKHTGKDCKVLYILKGQIRFLVLSSKIEYSLSIDTFRSRFIETTKLPELGSIYKSKTSNLFVKVVKIEKNNVEVSAHGDTKRCWFGISYFNDNFDFVQHTNWNESEEGFESTEGNLEFDFDKGEVKEIEVNLSEEDRKLVNEVFIDMALQTKDYEWLKQLTEG